MKLSNPLTRKWKWNFTALSFAFPCVGMLVVMLISGYIPFGKTSMLYSDMYHQYYPFFLAFRRSLRQGQSLLYNWSIGMGVDYLGLISYYLASPLNLLSVLLQLQLRQLGPQHLHGVVPVLELAALRLAEHHDARRQVGQTDGGGGLVDVLTACTAGSVGINTDIIRLDFNFRIILNFRHNIAGRKRGLPSACAVEGRHTHQTVNPLLGFQIAIGIFAVYLNSNRCCILIFSIRCIGIFCFSFFLRIYGTIRGNTGNTRC